MLRNVRLSKCGYYNVIDMVNRHGHFRPVHRAPYPPCQVPPVQFICAQGNFNKYFKKLIKVKIKVTARDETELWPRLCDPGVAELLRPAGDVTCRNVF